MRFAESYFFLDLVELADLIMERAVFPPACDLGCDIGGGYQQGIFLLPGCLDYVIFVIDTGKCSDRDIALAAVGPVKRHDEVFRLPVFFRGAERILSLIHI